MEHPTVFPALTYDDPQGAVDFLERAFGGERHAVYMDGDKVRHAELRFGTGIVMFGAAGPEGARRSSIYVTVPEPDALCERARTAGAEITREPHDTDYGSREFGAKDPEGNEWSFGTYQPFTYDPTV